MTRGQFTRRLKKARRAQRRLANGRSQQDGAARWIATMRVLNEQAAERFAAGQRPDQVTATNDLIGR